MKRKFEFPAPTERELTGPKYWRSLDELAETPGFKEQVAREFPGAASTMEGVDRRQFFKIMAASFALGGIGLAGCRRPEAHILPYGKSYEEIIPGLPLYFATAFPLRKHAIPLLAETHQGRPTKLEGNPTFKSYGGATSLFAQASILDLYDPDRAMVHTKGGVTIDNAGVDDFLASVAGTYAANGGSGLAFLADESASPTRARLLAGLRKKFPKALWAEYEPVADEPPVAAAEASFGRTVKPIFQFAKAKRIVSIDADFLGAEDGKLYYAREFAKGRRVRSQNDAMNRLYVAESNYTLTGGMADHRLRLASSHMLAFAAALAAKITGDSSYTRFTEGVDLGDKWISACADDLSAHQGECLVVAGSHLSPQVHVIVNAINATLGNLGHTVEYVRAEPRTASTLTDLADAIKAGTVKTLVIFNGNPVYNAPADLDWAALQRSVPQVIRYGYYVDETSAKAQVHIAAAHYLESWGDARTLDGTIVPIQPMILPLFNGLTEIEILARLAGAEKTDPYTLVYETITGLTGGDPEESFRRFLFDGLLTGTGYEKTAVTFDADGAAGLLRGATPTPKVSADSLEVRFVADYKMDDGRFNNNGWLQECPDPITRITWDNPILISPRLAQDLNVEMGQSSLLQVARKELDEIEVGRDKAWVAELTVNGRTVKGPLHIQPGLANYTIIASLGYGRTKTGRIGEKAGFNAYTVRTAGAMHVATGATLRVTAERYMLANTQIHWSMEGRSLIREANYDEFHRDPSFVNDLGAGAHDEPVWGAEGEHMTLQQRATETPRGLSMYQHPNYTGTHQWAMSIDLNTCIGCGACVVACQAENNIAIVGKLQVVLGREMHWIRIDRYYSSGSKDNREIPEAPQSATQPVNCQMCENAPCEMVCPVNATVHDDEGINVMTYNRCIGTRYCANNCPYKVRRFNFFDWNKRSIDSLYMGPLGPAGMPDLLQMQKNPDVTVRMRGIMEKCTYCLQRIKEAEISQLVKARDSNKVVVPDGAVQTACQQVCPVEAIVFGNINDTESRVYKLKTKAWDYSLLGSLNTRPRTTYLAKLRNPNPAMPDYYSLPLSRREYDNKQPAPLKGIPPEDETDGVRYGATAVPSRQSAGGLS